MIDVVISLARKLLVSHMDGCNRKDERVSVNQANLRVITTRIDDDW
jgi:hypothetical protein